jgi:hypothetical protein
MLTRVAVVPALLSVRPVGFRPTPYDWVPLAVIILLIVIFVGVYSRGGRSRGRTAHQSRRRNHGHQAVSKRRR